MRRVVLTGLVLTAVVLVAGLFRLYDIQQFPPGLFPDEAANGEDALLINSGDLRPFYPRGNGREALYFYLEAAAIGWLGIGFWQLHLVSALIGTATVLAMYFATRVWYGRIAGLLAALFLATNHWHVTMSRTGFRAILIPLFVALFTAWAGYTIRSVKQGKKKMSYAYAALSGAAFAGGFYTYIAYRVMAGVVLGVLFLLVIAAAHKKIGFPHGRRYGRQLIISIVTAILVFAPLGWYFVQEPADFVGRAGQVSIFNQELQDEYGGGTLAGTLIYSTRETLLSFFAGSGDLNWRHNVAGFPLLNPLVGMLFLLGLAWAIRGVVMVGYKIWRGEEVHLGMSYAYFLLIIAGMLVPVIATAEGMPHGLRSIGLVVPIFVLAGTAGAVIVNWLRRRMRGSVLLGAGYGIMALLLLVGIIYDGGLYFGVARNDAGAYYDYRADLTQAVKYIEEYEASQGSGRGAAKPYLVLDGFSLQTPHFLLSVRAHEYTTGDEVHPDEEQHRYRSVVPEKSYLINMDPGEIMIFTQSTLPDADRYKEMYPGVELVESQTNRFGEEIMRVYQGSPKLKR